MPRYVVKHYFWVCQWLRWIKQNVTGGKKSLLGDSEQLLVSCWSVWLVLEIKAASSWFCEWTSQGKLSPLPQVIRLYGDTNINKHCTGHSCIFCLCDFSSLWWQLILLLESPKILIKDLKTYYFIEVLTNYFIPSLER